MPPGKILKDARALLASKQTARMAGSAGDNNVQPANDPNDDLIDVSRSSDESSLTFDEVLQLACQQAVQFQKDKLWLISVILEIQTDLKKNSRDVAKVESDLAKVMNKVNEMCTKQEDVLRFIHSSSVSPPAPTISSQKPKLLSKEHFLNVRTSQVKRVRVDDWIRWSDLSLDIKPEPETVYVLRSDRPPKDINDGYHWHEIEKKKGRSSSNANSWTAFCDPKANCQKMVKRVKVCMGDRGGETCQDMAVVANGPPHSKPQKTTFQCCACNYLAVQYFGSHSCSRRAKPVSFSTDVDLTDEQTSGSDDDESSTGSESPPATPAEDVDTNRAEKYKKFLMEGVFLDKIVIGDDQTITFQLWDYVNGFLKMTVPSDGSDRSCPCPGGTECWHSVRVFMDLKFDILDKDSEVLTSLYLSETNFRRVLAAAKSLRNDHVSHLPQDDKFYIEEAPSDRRICRYRSCRSSIPKGSYCVYTWGRFWIDNEKSLDIEKRAYFCAEKGCFGDIHTGRTLRNIFTGTTIYARAKVPLLVIKKLRDQGIVVNNLY